MSTPPPKPKILLDWFTVSYRSVASVVVPVLVAVFAAGWYWIFYAPSKPRQEAQEAISRAEEKRAQSADVNERDACG